MRIERVTYEPPALLDFYSEALTALGALCDRTWHDRLEVLAEGRAAALWNAEGALHAVELHFASADATAARDASREIFPGCPLTFRLCETLFTPPLILDRLVLGATTPSRPPDPAAMEKLWRSQFPETKSWRLTAEPKPAFHFSLVALARCEIQAIDQHWSLRRLAVGLPGGEPDESLARELDFAECVSNPALEVPWPASDPQGWSRLIARALDQDLAEELSGIRARQEISLRRELDRIDDYFEHYARELADRARRTAKEAVKVKTSDRLAAAQAEHARRRADQVARHELRVHPHLDALLLIAEPAWRTEVRVERAHETQTAPALFVPRARHWEV